MQSSPTKSSQKGFAAYVAILAVVAVFVSMVSILLLNNPPAPANLYQAAIVSTTAAPDANAAIAFVQAIGNNAGYGPTSKTLSLAFPANNTSGNLLILSVNWGNTAIQVSSVTDTRGNVYTNISGQVRYGKGYPQSNQLYYAKNIPGGVNTITVTMSAKPSTVFEARAYEYAGLDPTSPLDKFSSATGTGATQVNPVAGSGFTGRPVTNAGNTLGEDKTVTVTGSYNATETIGTKTIDSGSKTTAFASELIFGLGNYNFKQATPDWFMSMATFKAATVNPTPTPTPSPTPIPPPVIPPPPPTPTPVPTPTPTPNPTPSPTPIPSPIIFKQVNAATPQSPMSSVAVAYNATQVAGDLNVIVVGWNDTVASVSTVTDSKGNPYTLAIGPTRGSGASQSIYYAKNITAGANTVTVTFNQAAQYVDIRVLEYSGLSTTSPLDKVAGATGSAATANSGSASTTAANELIVGAGITSGGFSAAGIGFTVRIITSPDTDIAEDQIVSVQGTYNASAPVTGNWVMQMATFK